MLSLCGCQQLHSLASGPSQPDHHLPLWLPTPPLSPRVPGSSRLASLACYLHLLGPCSPSRKCLCLLQPQQTPAHAGKLSGNTTSPRQPPNLSRQTYTLSPPGSSALSPSGKSVMSYYAVSIPPAPLGLLAIRGSQYQLNALLIKCLSYVHLLNPQLTVCFSHLPASF